jgi:formylglycine-generating enzyme required for sulfatase activity
MDFLAAGGIDLGTFRESVVVYANIASNKWVDSEGNLIASRTFSAAEFCQQDSSLSGLSVAWSDSSTPALTPTFASDNFSYDAGLVAKGSTVSFTPTSSISGQAITYTWNGGSPRSIVTGQASSPLSLVGGTNTILITVEAPNGAFGCFSTYTVTMQWVPAYSGSTGIEMVKIPAGSFNNGSSVVTLSSFLLGKYDVTQAQYAAVIGSNPSSFLGDTSRPVEQVNWYDALVFCNTLSMQEGLRPVYSIAGSTDPASWGTVPTSESTTWDSATMDLSAEGYRLPTEAEWEYAAMGGNLTHGYTYAGSNSIDGVAWYTANSGSTTHPVGQKAPNELGLYDMCGNVCNWCWDWYNDNLPTAAQTDPTGPESGSVRVIHAGEYENVASNCEIFTRGSAAPNGSINYIGFRVARGTQISGWRMVAAESGGSIWYSSDSGSTWNKSSSAPALNWTSLAGSADGMRLIATNGGYQVNGGIYLSTDGGATWTQTSALSEQYSGLASSADGKILGATDYDGSSNFFYSTNSGATWQSTTLPNPTGYDVFWVRPRCSTDGTRWVIDDGGAGHPYPAVWYGTFVAGSWTWVETGITYSQYGEDLCGSAISGDGSMILAGTTNHLYTWYTPTQEMKEVSFSSTGYLLPAISSDGTCYSVATSDSIFVSTDQGGTWKAQTTGLPTLSMSSICLSTDGSVIVAGSVVDAAKPNSGDLYISKDVGATYSILSSLDVAAGGKLNWQAVFMQP